jgi:hypothetical protein
MRLLIVGGSDASIAAALRARELDPAAEVTGCPTFGAWPIWQSVREHRTAWRR